MPLTAITHIFAGAPLDRASLRRTDEAWLAARRADPSSWAIALWNGEALGERDETAARLARLPMGLADELAPGDERMLFLGVDTKACAVFAIDLEGAADPAAGPLAGRGVFVGLRELAAKAPADEAAIAATARAMFEWRRRHRFCSVCGQPSRPVEGGWKRVCPACGAEHFPRTDPVAIMLPVAGERCLLGRNARFPEGMFSALAGFVEPGETVEEACARELMEEVGLKAVSVAYHSCQPWPFPSSLMIGLIAQVEAAEARPDQTELVEARWFTRAEAKLLMARKLEGLFCPPPFAIAHQLIKTWAEQT